MLHQLVIGTGSQFATRRITLHVGVTVQCVPLLPFLGGRQPSVPQLCALGCRRRSRTCFRPAAPAPCIGSDTSVDCTRRRPPGTAAPARPHTELRSHAETHTELHSHAGADTELHSHAGADTELRSHAGTDRELRSHAGTDR